MGEGALSKMSDGLFEKFPFDEIFGIHNMPGMSVGVSDAKADAIMSADDNLRSRSAASTVMPPGRIWQRGACRGMRTGHEPADNSRAASPREFIPLVNDVTLANEAIDGGNGVLWRVKCPGEFETDDGIGRLRPVLAQGARMLRVSRRAVGTTTLSELRLQ